jgi:hypothetical protein
VTLEMLNLQRMLSGTVQSFQYSNVLPAKKNGNLIGFQSFFLRSPHEGIYQAGKNISLL